MFRDLDIDEVAAELWVGRYPSSPEFVTTLAQQAKITGLISVQSDDDLAILGINWQAIESYLKQQGITVTRVPIIDFNDRELLKGLPDAIAAVHFLRATGKRTYLHCTAGLNRSPSVAIAYLAAHQGMSLDEAWEQVTSRRHCMPVRKVLEKWWKQHQKKKNR